VHKTGTKVGQETKFGSKLTASLKKWLRKKQSEIPKYLTGKKNGSRRKSIIDTDEN
jgi:hypothetical protein